MVFSRMNTAADSQSRYHLFLLPSTTICFHGMPINMLLE